MLYGIPVVLLGAHPMLEKGITYEFTHCSELEKTIQLAINKNGWREKKKAWRAFLARIIKYYLFPQSDEMAEMMNRSIDESARFLLKQVNRGNFKIPQELIKPF
jgi:hypothetical protein